ncbi:hypothetical protein MYX77_01345 [Acidobacteriia bacterium AH_259_A11_L15]|nr:hypothetical protein [Acidobacteriia bacterium AH_259_A11_L15]
MQVLPIRCSTLFSLIVISLAASSFACRQSEPSGPQVPPGDLTLAEGVPLEEGMKPTVVVKKPEEGTVPADANRRTIERGLEVNLTFENTGPEPIKTHLEVTMEAQASQVVLIGRNNKEIVPIAIKREGSDFGYRTVETPGGIAIGGCVDNEPVALSRKGGGHAGLILLFCTTPGEKDTVIVMFDKPQELAQEGVDTLKIKCPLCPDNGLVFPLDLAKLSPGP